MGADTVAEVDDGADISGKNTIFNSREKLVIKKNKFLCENLLSLSCSCVCQAFIKVIKICAEIIKIIIIIVIVIIMIILLLL